MPLLGLVGWPDWSAGRAGGGGSSGPAVAWVSIGVGGSCRDTGSIWDSWFSVDQLAQDSVEVVLYSVGSGSQWGWRGCLCLCGWPVEWIGPLWLGAFLWGAVDLLWSSLCCTRGISIHLIGFVSPDQQFSHLSGGSCSFLLLPSWLYSTGICWDSFGDGWLAHTAACVYGAVLTALPLFEPEPEIMY